MKNHQRTPLTEEQADQLLEALQGHHLEAIITLALVTGMRRDELLYLTWQDIDLEKGELHVRHTKTKSSDRMIHLPEVVVEVLKQYRLRQMEARAETGAVWQNLDLVFPDRMGEVLSLDYLLKGFYEILEQAGVPRIRFHDLRVARYRALQARVRAAGEGLEGAEADSLDDQRSEP
jgi:integrase